MQFGGTEPSGPPSSQHPRTIPDPVHVPDRTSTRRWGRLSWLFAGVWLIYLLPTLQDAATRPNLAARVVGVVAVVAFGVQYVTIFAALSRTRRAGRSPEPWWAVRALGSSIALFLVAAFTVGQSSLAMFVFIAVQGVFILPRRTGMALAALLIVVEETLSRIVPGWAPVDGLWISIALASVAVWGITGMIERNVELARAQATIADLAVQTERARFARDLHDILGHSLTVLTVKAELAGRLVGIDPERAGQEIAEVEQLARHALADVRAAVSGYREATLPRELASARVALEAAGIVAELPGAVDDVPPERRELLAWAIREGVTNVVRHSKAGRAWVRLDRNGVEIADDGVGPDVAGTSPLAEQGDRSDAREHGLAGLRERAAAAGGHVVVGRRDGGGFILRVGW
jgi:two-component system, NarL family, sensor histidine kinase DesK